EASARKAHVIEEIAGAIGVLVHVHAERSETLGRGAMRDACACVCARALAPPPVAAELCLPLCAPGGRGGLWTRGADEAAGAAAARALGGELAAPRAPGFTVIAKRVATPDGFPRRPGMATKRPLGGPTAGRDAVRPPR